MTVGEAARWWRREEPDLPVAEIARMLGVSYAKAWRETRAKETREPPQRTPGEQARADEVKAAVRSGLSYDALAKRFGWPH